MAAHVRDDLHAAYGPGRGRAGAGARPDGARRARPWRDRHAGQAGGPARAAKAQGQPPGRTGRDRRAGRVRRRQHLGLCRDARRCAAGSGPGGACRADGGVRPRAPPAGGALHHPRRHLWRRRCTRLGAGLPRSAGRSCHPARGAAGRARLRRPQLPHFLHLRGCGRTGRTGKGLDRASAVRHGGPPVAAGFRALGPRSWRGPRDRA